MEVTLSWSIAVGLGLTWTPSSSAPTWVSVQSDHELKILDNATSSLKNQDFMIEWVFASYSFNSPVSLGIIEAWKIDNCKTWESNSTKIWKVWNDGYTISSGKCVSKLINDAVIASKATMAVGFAASLASPQGAWSMINQFQVLMLMPLTNSYFPSDIIQYLTGMELSIFSFNFVSLSKLPILRDFCGFFDFEQTDEYIYGK